MYDPDTVRHIVASIRKVESMERDRAEYNRSQAQNTSMDDWRERYETDDATHTYIASTLKELADAIEGKL